MPIRTHGWTVGAHLEKTREVTGDAKKAVESVGIADKHAWLSDDGENFPRELRLTGEDIFAECGYYAQNCDVDLSEVSDFEAFLLPLKDELDVKVAVRDLQNQGMTTIESRIIGKRLSKLLSLPGGSVVASRDADSREIKGVLGYTRAPFIDMDEDEICVAVTLEVYQFQNHRDHGAALRAAFMRQMILDHETLIVSQARADVTLPVGLFMQSTTSLENEAHDFLELLEEAKNESFNFRQMPEFVEWDKYDEKINSHLAIG